MGSIWLHDLPDVLSDAGLNVTTYAGWESRSRSSGGYDQLLGIGIHHDASSSGSSDQSAWDWAWKNSSDRPIGAIRLGRQGLICVGAAGATNTMGKGGPLKCSRGTIPQDKGNHTMIAIEAGNNGVGETWSSAMVDAYIRMCRALCDAYGLDAGRDIFTHNSYCEPSCPGRKVDPAGPTPSQPSLGGTSGNKIWNHTDFRNLVLGVRPPEPPEPEPPSEEEVTDDDIQKIAKAVWKYMTTDLTVNKPVTAEYLLQCTRGAAANADRQTRAGDAKNSVAEEVWTYGKRSLT